jgi:dUTP pyrophosphatase
MKIFRSNEKAILPEFATEGSAGFDLRACFEVTTRIKTFNPHNKMIEIPVKKVESGIQFQVQPQFRTLIPTGLIFDIPDKHVMKVYPRSGMAVKYGLTLANAVGVIDCDYIDEVFITLFNMSDTPITVYDGDRLAQAMLEKLPTYSIEEAKRRPKQKTTREGGFGSTGTE